MKLRKIAPPKWSRISRRNGKSQNEMGKVSARQVHLPIINIEATIKKEVSKDWLNPRLDTDGIVRCYGRLGNADLCEEMNIPIIFLKRERYIQLLIEDFQKQVLHVGVKQTLSKEEDIVLKKGKQKSNTYLDYARSIKKNQGGLFKMPAMSLWLKDKLIRSTPFQYTGLVHYIWKTITKKIK